MSNNVVTCPPLPFWYPIPNGVQDGKMVEIRGTVPYGADVFQINFVAGQDGGSHVADRLLHVSVRFTHRLVVRNSHLCGVWGSEEKDGAFPFASGQPFVLLVLVEQSGFRIAVDGQHCWEFFHRSDFTNASSLFVDGSIKIDEVRFFDKYIPNQFIGTCITPPVGALMPQTINNPPIPFHYPLYEGLKPNMMICISGRPSASVHRFSINLQCGSCPYPPPDIAFHMDARVFSASLVRNSRVGGCWGAEEKSVSAAFPFAPAAPFDLILRVEADRFVVAVNGRSLFEFQHRVHPLARVDTLSIEEDVVVSSVAFERF